MAEGRHKEMRMKLTLLHTDTGYGLETSVSDLGIIPAAIGRSGLVDAADKREGDGATPRGCWMLRRIMLRTDRMTMPVTPMPVAVLTPRQGWCDDPSSAAYNLPVDLPFAGSHECLWRDDHAYDVVIPLGYNDDPVEPGRGSAIFFHCLEAGRDHTEGCVAISRAAMQMLLPYLTPQSQMIIDP